MNLDTAALMTAIVTLSGIVGTLWKIEQKRHGETERRLNDCEEDRDNQAGLIHSVVMAVVNRDPKGLQAAAEACTVRLEKKRSKPASDA